MQDPWTHKTPLSPDELSAARAASIASVESLFGHGSRAASRIREHGFTCDNCDRAPVCALAFDLYNTADDGSCLYDK